LWLQDYPVDGKTDALGVKQMNFSLKYLMANCPDFIEEESLLQFNGQKMGVIIDQTPKCHCELAGEGVEYSWACAKNEFRQKPIQQKKSKELFKNTVRECLSREILTDARVRSFSKRAQEYICAYHVLHEQMMEQPSDKEQEGIVSSDNSIVPVKIEALVKQFKTHLCALDFDHGFIKSVVRKSESEK
jgi:hypothetical protein